MNLSSKDNIIKLDVGGIHYKTTLDTITYDSNSMLANMFSGRHKLIVDSDGYYFIDRDGEIFKYIIKYLRDKTLDIGGFSDSLINDIMKEADYFNLEGLVEICSKKKYYLLDIASKNVNINLVEFEKEFNIVFAPEILHKYTSKSKYRFENIHIDRNSYYGFKNVLNSCFVSENGGSTTYYHHFMILSVNIPLFNRKSQEDPIVWFSFDQCPNQDIKPAIDFIQKWSDVFIIKTLMNNKDIRIDTYHPNQYNDDNTFEKLINTNIIYHPYCKIKTNLSTRSYEPTALGLVLEFYIKI
jgi:hypothetical protein